MPVLSLVVMADDITRGAARRQHRGLLLRGGLSRFVLARTLVGRFFGRDAVVALEPAAEINIGAPPRAERLMPRHRWLAADRAAALTGRQSGHWIARHGSDIGSARRDVKSRRVAARLGGNRDMAAEAGFEYAQPRRGRAPP